MKKAKSSKSPAKKTSKRPGAKRSHKKKTAAARPRPTGSTDPGFTVMNMPRSQLQAEVGRWAERCFGVVEALSPRQRAFRVLEEAIELAQAVGVDPVKARELVDYVFARPPGDVDQEVGGLGVTLLAFGAATHWNVDSLERQEVERVLSMPAEHFTDRNATKNLAGMTTMSSAWDGVSVTSTGTPLTTKNLEEAAQRIRDGEGGHSGYAPAPSSTPTLADAATDPVPEDENDAASDAGD